MYMDTISCPFCGEPYSIDDNIKTDSFFHTSKNVGTGNRYYFNINGCDYKDPFFNYVDQNCDGGTYELTISRCPHCNKEKITIKRYNVDNPNKNYSYDEDLIENVRPKFTGIRFPEYVPLAIRQDYEEANTILKLSPKASATLSRRCMQGMIRNHFGVTDERTLKGEIDAIKESPLMSKEVLDALNALRDIGNIGAHMENDINLIIDVDEGEAERLIKFIEYLINTWYIQEHDHAQLLKDITEIGNEKKALKKFEKGKSSVETYTATNNSQINGDNNTNVGNINIKSHVQEDINKK